MCFFEQQRFSCGDYKWGPLRQQCGKEYRTGETCGMKLVMYSVNVDGTCRLCHSIETKTNRLYKEEDRIRRWRAETVLTRSASIEASENSIKELRREIARLQNELDEKRRRLN